MTDIATKSSAAVDPVAVLRNPATIRGRAQDLLAKAQADELTHFSIDMARFPEIADFVAGVIRENYPDLKLPYHSRWRHFSVGDIDRWGALQEKMAQDATVDAREVARRAIDLAVISVLLDAGAGSAWIYQEPETGVAAGRSEGLALASFRMFEQGLFSSNPDNPWQVDAAALAGLSTAQLAEGFQISAENPMAGFDGRADLVVRLADALTANTEIFGAARRPGHIFDYVAGDKTSVQAADILAAVLAGLSPIWPGRYTLGGENLGDVWRHGGVVSDDATNGYVPFHKLSQWLTYSLLEPFIWGGVAVEDLDALTGLAEYRNGGLFVDGGVLLLKDPAAANTPHAPDEEIIVEWRALTLALLDALRVPVAERLGVNEADFPLACLLEGGSWAAGRKLAFRRDPAGDPPISIISDGTVF